MFASVNALMILKRTGTALNCSRSLVGLLLLFPFVKWCGWDGLAGNGCC